MCGDFYLLVKLSSMPIGGSPIQLNDLTTHEKFVLKLIGEDPKEKHIGQNLRAANNLAAYGLAEYHGGMKFGLTTEGNELYLERKLFFDQGQPENITRSKSLDYVGDPSQLPMLVSKASI